MNGRAMAVERGRACGYLRGASGRLRIDTIPRPRDDRASTGRDGPCDASVRTAARDDVAVRVGQRAGGRPRSSRSARAPERSISRRSSSGPEALAERRRRAPRRPARASRARRPVSGSPRQPQSTVRSLGSTAKQMPWSQPWTAVLGHQQVPALAVGVVDQGIEHRHRAAGGRPGSGSCAGRRRRRRSRSRAGPCPGQPVRHAPAWAARWTSRRLRHVPRGFLASARVPCGKSASGRSPRIGLYTACSGSAPPRQLPGHRELAPQDHVGCLGHPAGDDLSSPSRSARRASAVVDRDVAPPAARVGLPDRSVQVPVAPDAHVAFRVERLAAERAGRSTRRDQPRGSPREPSAIAADSRTRSTSGPSGASSGTSSHRRSSSSSVAPRRRPRRPPLRSGLDGHLGLLAVPGDGQRARPEGVPERLVEGSVVVARDGSAAMLGDARSRPAPAAPRRSPRPGRRAAPPGPSRGSPRRRAGPRRPGGRSPLARADRWSRRRTGRGHRTRRCVWPRPTLAARADVVLRPAWSRRSGRR